MRVFYALVLAIAPLSIILAQDALVVLPDTDVIFSANTIVSVDDLAITPDADFLVSGFSLNKFSAIQHPSSSVAVSRVYRFSKTMEDFSGSIRIRYEDSELNGLSESDLRLNIHDGSAWHDYGNNINDEVANTVHTASLANVQLNEITLAAVLSPLPLRWGPVTASRIKRSVVVAWVAYEQTDVSYFTVERSLDSRHWHSVKTEIPAFNLASKQYSITDEKYHSGQLFYRVKGTDKDGHFYYSPVRTIGAESIGDGFILYPNPVQSRFTLKGNNPENIHEIQLFNAGGILLKIWQGTQHGYDMASFPAGAYSIRIVKKDNTVQLIQVTKP